MTAIANTLSQVIERPRLFNENTNTFLGKRILSVTTHRLFSKIEYVLSLCGYLVFTGDKPKVIYGSEKTVKRFLHDQQEENPFKKMGGYALNTINLEDFIFDENLNCFVEKKYLFLLDGIEINHLKNTIFIEVKRS